MQVIADAAGRLGWASPTLPGSAHDLSAARSNGIIDALTSADVMTFADKGYPGARGGSVRSVPGSRVFVKRYELGQGREGLRGWGG